MNFGRNVRWWSESVNIASFFYGHRVSLKCGRNRIKDVRTLRLDIDGDVRGMRRASLADSADPGNGKQGCPMFLDNLGNGFF